MRTTQKLRRTTCSLCITLCCLVAAAVQAQTTTAFTYQGKLTDNGSAANGSFPMQFALFDAQTGGAQIGPTVTIGNVSVENGAFTVQLDFEAGAFPGANRYLQISVKKPSDPSFTILDPRQQVMPAPYALQAANATNASNAANAAQLGGVAASNYVQTNDARLSNPTVTLPVSVSSNAFRIGSPGDYVSGSNANPTLVLQRGLTYRFDVNANGHPLRIASSQNGPAFNTGVTNNHVMVGVLTIKVPMDAPNQLHYYCLAHVPEAGVINIQ